ncbi:MAG: HAMP domain-containing sensor histidine kinase [bacterium]
MPVRARGSRWLPALFILAFLVLLAATNVWIHQRNRKALDDDLGRRLTAIAGLLVDTRAVDGDLLFGPQGMDRSYLASIEGQLEEIQRSYDLDAILLLDPDEYTVRYSSSPALYTEGSLYPYREEHTGAILEAVTGRHPSASATRRVGGSRDVYLKSGFAPVRTLLQDQLVAVLVVEASADFFEVLGRMRGVMITGTAAATVLMLLLMAGYLGLQGQARRARQALERENRMAALGRMASQVAHEIRNPAGIIKYAAERMEKWLDAQDGGRRERDPELKEMVEYIREETRRLQDTTERYLTYARQGTMQPREVAPRELLDSAAEALRRHGLPDGITVRVETELPDAPPVLRADPDLLRQALLNLGMNAVEAMGSSGEAVFFARSAGEAYSLGVEDDGPGIPDRQKGKVFEPFYSTRPEGNGLGLFIVEQIVRSHGGEVTVEDREEGGTRVIMELPAGGQPPREEG